MLDTGRAGPGLIEVLFVEPDLDEDTGKSDMHDAGVHCLSPRADLRGEKNFIYSHTGQFVLAGHLSVSSKHCHRVKLCDM